MYLQRKDVIPAAAVAGAASLMVLGYFLFRKEPPALPPLPQQAKVEKPQIKPTVSVTPSSSPCSPRNYKVAKGDSLWRIARHEWGGRGYFWPVLAETNTARIANPNLIKVGWVLTIPCLCDLPAVAKKLAARKSKVHSARSVAKPALSPASQSLCSGCGVPTEQPAAVSGAVISERAPFPTVLPKEAKWIVIVGRQRAGLGHHGYGGVNHKTP